MTLRIEQRAAPPTAAMLDRAENVIVLLPDAAGDAVWDELPHGPLLRKRLERARRDAGHQGPVTTDLPNPAGTRATIDTVASETSTFELLGRLRAHLQAHAGARRIEVVIHGLPATVRSRVIEAAASAALAVAAPMPDFRQSPPKPRRLERLRFHGVEARIDLARAQAAAEGNGLARELTMLPPNRLTPLTYRQRIEALAREEGWAFRFRGQAALKRLGAGAFLAVTQADPDGHAGIVELQYRPPDGSPKTPELSLVGKGLCYDTGGVNLKPARHMQGMHEDMAGSAVALGVLLALTRLRYPRPVRCWLALAENSIGPRACRPGDVVTAANGTTIEIVHTDAEGRMVLADTLALAARSAPALIIDYATLTGSCIQALGTAYSGAITNQEALHGPIIAAGRASGERVWPFPFDADYDKALESHLADVRQCTLEGEADHILAGRFLSRFVADRPWLHIDLSSSSHKGGLAQIPTDTTGFGIRFTLELLHEHGLPDSGHRAPERSAGPGPSGAGE